MVPIKGCASVNVCNDSLCVNWRDACEQKAGPWIIFCFIEAGVQNSCLWLIISRFNTLWSASFALPLTFPNLVPVPNEVMHFHRLQLCCVLCHLGRVSCAVGSFPRPPLWLILPLLFQNSQSGASWIWIPWLVFLHNPQYPQLNLCS